MRALSSVGSEHLPYKQGVTGSNPVGPTVIKASDFIGSFFILYRFVSKLLVIQSYTETTIYLNKFRYN